MSKPRIRVQAAKVPTPANDNDKDAPAPQPASKAKGQEGEVEHRQDSAGRHMEIYQQKSLETKQKIQDVLAKIEEYRSGKHGRVFGVQIDMSLMLMVPCNAQPEEFEKAMAAMRPDIHTQIEIVVRKRLTEIFDAKTFNPEASMLLMGSGTDAVGIVHDGMVGTHEGTVTRQ